MQGPKAGAALSLRPAHSTVSGGSKSPGNLLHKQDNLPPFSAFGAECFPRSKSRHLTPILPTSKRAPRHFANPYF